MWQIWCHRSKVLRFAGKTLFFPTSLIISETRINPCVSSVQTQKEAEGRVHDCLNLEKIQCCEKHRLLFTPCPDVAWDFVGHSCQPVWGPKAPASLYPHTESRHADAKIPRCGNCWMLHAQHTKPCEEEMPASLVFLGLPSGQIARLQLFSLWLPTFKRPNTFSPRMLAQYVVIFSPNNYLSSRRREKRWLKKNMRCLETVI